MTDYDVIVVGARVAGAATAMLLARNGRHVLLLDRGRYGTDTLSTHALMRGGALLLSRWGLLDRIAAAGTPPITRTVFDYGTDRVSIAIKATPGVQALYAPRRTVLDPLIVDAAAAAGAEVHFGVRVTGLLRDGTGRVIGVQGRDRTGADIVARAPLTVGADGLTSTVAREAGAATVRVARNASTVIYGYWSELPVEGYEWFYRNGHSAGLIPTNAGEVCVFAGTAAHQISDVQATYHRLLDSAAGGAGGRLARARRPYRLHTWTGRPGFIRQAYGPGWALVGDAGSFVDPLSTHGITDALRDAQLLSASIAQHGPDLAAFAATRDDVVEPLLDVVDRIAGHQWDEAGIRSLLRELSAAMSREFDVISSPSPPPVRR